MHKITHKLPLGAAAVFLLSLAMSAGAAAQAPDLASAIDRYLTARTEMGGFSGAVLVARGDRVIFRKGYGFADVEKRVPYTPETRQEVASISKMFTAMAALKLRDRGKLKLDDPVCKYIDGCPDAWRPITVQQLMRHTSGIPDYEEPLGLGSEKYLAFMVRPTASVEIFENAKKLPLDFTPGEKFNYSNTAYIVLSRVVEKAAGEPFAKFVTEAVLKPAGMKQSGVIDIRRLPKELAKGYTYGGIGWDMIVAGLPLTDGHLQTVPQLPLTSPEGDAWLYTTVDDLYKWSLIMDGSKLVPKAEADEVFTAGLGNYGYGWFVGKGFDRRRMRHNGGLPGYISDFVKFPDEKVTIIVFSNLDRARLGSISRDISAMVLGTPYDMPVRGTVIKLQPEQIKNLEGVYKMSDGRTLTIVEKPDFLTAELKGQYTAGLIPLSASEFYFPLGDGRAIFTLDTSGKATSVNMRYGGEDHVAVREN